MGRTKLEKVADSIAGKINRKVEVAQPDTHVRVNIGWFLRRQVIGYQTGELFRHVQARVDGASCVSMGNSSRDYTSRLDSLDFTYRVNSPSPAIAPG